MIQTYLYTAMMVLFTIIVVIKKKNILGIMLAALYSAIAFFSTICASEQIVSTDNITLFPYLYLIIVYFIAFWPFLNVASSFKVDSLVFEVNKKYIAFAWIYNVMALIAIKYYIPIIAQLFSSGSWMANRNALYSGTLAYSYSWYEYYALIFSGYFRLLALIVAFALYRSEKVFLSLLTLATALISGALNGMYSSSRGAIVDLALITVALYLFFSPDISEKKRKLIHILIIGAVIATIPYMIAVTTSRFGTNSAAKSLINYLGHAPMIFNSGVSIANKHLYGEFAFGTLFGDSQFSPSSIGGSWGTGFFTFVGWLFIDWGWVGTLIVASLISALLYYIISKKEYRLADVYLVMFAYSTLLRGVFVIGRDYAYNIVATILIYIFIKIFFDKYTFVLGPIRF